MALSVFGINIWFKIHFTADCVCVFVCNDDTMHETGRSDDEVCMEGGGGGVNDNFTVTPL